MLDLVVNLVHQRAAHPTERPSNTSAAHAQRHHVMSQQHQALKPYTEADVQLAISDIQNNQIQGLRRAETIYKVPKTTIRRQRDGTHCRRDCEPNLKSLLHPNA
jgi:hypothetical protein